VRHAPEHRLHIHELFERAEAAREESRRLVREMKRTVVDAEAGVRRFRHAALSPPARRAMRAWQER
jgi:hypothetical protein